jgi:hypothetical protein
LCGINAGYDCVPGYDYGDGNRATVMMGRSIKELTKAQACNAITMGLHIGDNPQDQGLSSQSVRWSDAVLLGLGFNLADFR